MNPSSLKPGGIEHLQFPRYIKSKGFCNPFAFLLSIKSNQQIEVTSPLFFPVFFQVDYDKISEKQQYFET